MARAHLAVDGIVEVTGDDAGVMQRLDESRWDRGREAWTLPATKRAYDAISRAFGRSLELSPEYERWLKDKGFLLDQPLRHPEDESKDTWWYEIWQGMPEYVNRELTAWKTLKVHFRTPEDLRAFAELVGQTNITNRTPSIWFPQVVPLSENTWRYADADGPRPPDDESPTSPGSKIHVRRGGGGRKPKGKRKVAAVDPIARALGVA